MPAVEALEDRTLLATFVVDTLVDENDGDYSAGDLSLREAIELAGAPAYPGPDVIEFDPALSGASIVLTEGELVVDGDLEISGPGRYRLTISGNFESRVFRLSGQGVLISGLRITRGLVDGPDANGGGVLSTGSAELRDVLMDLNRATNGGGISNTGALTIVGSDIHGNNAKVRGGGIENNGELTLIETSVSGNSVPVYTSTPPGTLETYGGGIDNTGDILAIRSSISTNSGVDGGGVYHTGGSFVAANTSLLNNRAYRNGGGIYATTAASAGVHLVNVTIARNVAELNSVEFDGAGGGVHLAGPGGYLANTLVINNQRGYGSSAAPDDIFGTPDATSSHNLISDAATSGGLVDGVNGNIVGNGGTGTIDESTVLLRGAGDDFPLPYEMPTYGGPTAVRALVGNRPGRINPAIDAGSNALAHLDGVPLTGDQRSLLVERIFDGNFDGTATIDIGAWEIGRVDVIVDSVDPNGPGLNLDQAIRLAGSNPYYYQYANPLSRKLGWYNRVTVPADLQDLTRETAFGVYGVLELIGPGSDQFRVEARNHGFGMLVGSESNVKVSGVTITGASEYGVMFDHFGLSHLELRDVHILDNGSPEEGAGGGGIVSRGFNPVSLHLYDSTIAGNGSIYGGVHLRTLASLVIQNTTITNNRSSDQGGGVYAHIREIVSDDEHPPFIIDGSTISDNEAAGRGGGISLSLGSYHADGAYKAQFTNTTISGNRAAEAAGMSLRLSGGFHYVDASNLTIVGNVGGGLDSFSRIHNSIIAGNLSADGLSPLDVVAIGSGSTYNLIGDVSTSGSLMDGVNGNIVGNGGTGTLDLTTILDPTLADNGGPTLTHALVVGSPALDSGDTALAVDALGNPLLFDQRGPGFARVLGAAVDRGAFEGIATSTDIVYVNDDFPQAGGTIIADADPNIAGDQSAIVGVNAFADLQDALNAVDAGGHVRVTDDLASDGPGMYVGALIINRDVTIESTEGDRTAVVIDGGNATRVATIAGGANVVISGVTLQNGRVLSGSGGGLGILNGASVTLTSVDVLASSAEFGGGIFVDEATIVLNDTRVSGNIAGTDGGGIFSFGGSVTINGGRIENNSSGPRGGGVSLSQDGSTLAVDGTTFEGNSAEQGGGLYIGGLITGTHSIANATFQANHATSGNGGAIFVVGGDLLEVTDTLISSNTASSVGGGIYSISTAVKLMRSTLSNNSAGLNGGGAAVNGTGHRLDLLDTRVEQNTAGRQGGGLWNGSASILVLTAASQVTGNRASGDTHSGGGGGIYNNGGRLALAGGVLVELNVADGDAGAGGGIFTINGVVTLSESTVRGNTATRAGGGVEFFTGILELTNSQVEDNAATGGGADAPGDGGGIHVLGLSGQVGRINIIGGSVSGNAAARQGGGLWNQQGNIMVVRGGAVVDGNTASGDAAEDGGGGIFNRGGRLSVGEAAVISNNVADGVAGSGGGIFSTGSGVSIAGGTVISGNSASRAGGGIEVIDGLVTINDSTIENNTAGDGGGVHISGTNFTRVDLWNAIVRNNTAAQQGGGLWNQTNGVMLVRVGSQVTGNTASGDAADDGGGGIYNQGGRLIINNATIDGNNADGAAGSGGGVFTRNGVVTVENATISNNTAHRAGGGVEIIDGWFYTRLMNLTGNNVGGAAPSPGDGGGLHVTGTNLSRVRIDRATIADNTASGSGGGLWHQAGSLMVIFGSTTIANNTAAGDAAGAGGGGIFNAGGRLAITAATLSGNSANGTNGAGGGILSLAGGLTLDNSTVSGNTANGNGGGVVSNGEFIAANATIVGNRSDADGAGGGSGGGLFNGGLATIKNTIVAGNLVGAGSAASDLAGNTLRPASAHNIVGDAGSAAGLTHGSNGNIVGNAGIGVLALASIVNPTLASNGGPTLTHALAQNSPAINAGNNNLAKDAAGMAFTTDQRGIGYPRVVGGTVDIGGVEARG